MAKRYDNATWEQIRDEYRSGSLTVRELSRMFGPTEAAIRARAKKGDDGKPWERDLTDAVRAATRAKLNKAELGPGAQPQEIIEAASTRNFKAVQAHMKRLGRLAEIEDKLLDRIERGFADMDVFDEAESLVDRVMRAAEAEGKSRDMLFADLFTPEVDRSALLKNLTKCHADLTNAVGKRIQMERQALNIDKPEGDEKAAERFVFEAVFTGEAADA